MTDHEQLVARLEAAEAGSREDSDEVLLILGWEQIAADPEIVGLWLAPDGSTWSEPLSPTESVDDGLALLQEMPGEWDYCIARGRNATTGEVQQHAVIGQRDKQNSCDGSAATVELALSAALVRAVAQQKEASDG